MKGKMTFTSFEINEIEAQADSTDMTSLSKVFMQNRFDPSTDSAKKIPDEPGNYILCLKPNAGLPKVPISPSFTDFNGLKVIYTGIAGTSLRKRDFRQHFEGNNAGKSTLRKSLGVLFGYKQVPRDKNPNSKKTKFGLADEEELTVWMRNHLIMFFRPKTSIDSIESIEIKLINHFNPPLNIKGNHNSVNADFRAWLTERRSDKT